MTQIFFLNFLKFWILEVTILFQCVLTALNFVKGPHVARGLRIGYRCSTAYTNKPQT